MNGNCQLPKFMTPFQCEAVRTRLIAECDCRWCVFNREFNKANRIPIINP